MSDDLNDVFREMWPGLHPGERIGDYGEVIYSAAWLDDRRLQAVPDKEEQVSEKLPRGIHKGEDGTLYGVTRGSGDLVTVSTPPKTLPLADALQDLALLVGDSGRIVTNVHDLPIAFFGRDDVEKIDILVMEDRVHVTGNLVIGGHKFGCFSKGFPMGAE